MDGIYRILCKFLISENYFNGIWLQIPSPLIVS